MNKNENEALKKTLLHYINLEYYANGIDEEFQTLLEDLQKKCRLAIEDKPTLNTKLQYSLVMRYVKEQVEEFRKKLEERLEEEAEVVMKEEQEFLGNLYNKTDSEILSQQEEMGDEEDEEIEEDETSGGRSGASKAALALGGITLSKLLFAPIDGRDTTSQFVERTAKNITRTYDTAVRSGYLFGQKSEDVANQVDRNMKQISHGMQAGIQTAIPSYAKTTDRIFFKQNNMEVVWCAVLDGKGCIVCYSYNGLHYPSVALAPTIPHNRCRCILCPAKDLKEPIPTYEEYIESLSDDEQYHILGENRYNLWKLYKTPLEKFVNNGQKVPLSELEKELEPKINKIIEKSKAMLAKKFPDEKWVEKSKNLFVSQSRIDFSKKNKTEMAKLAKEIEQAKILTDRKIVSFLPNEIGDGKHYDSLSNLIETEFKTVTGSRDKIGDNFKDALKQGHNIFIRTNGETSKSAYSSILGKTKVLLLKGKEISPNRTIYFWDEQQKELHIWKLDEIIKIARTLL